MKSLVVLYILLSFQLTSAAWNQFQGDAAHTGVSLTSGPSTSALSWSLDIGANISPFGGPSVGYYDGGVRVVLGADDGVHIISPAGYQTGFIPTPDPVETVVAIVSDALYFGAGDSLYAYQPSRRWWAAPLHDIATHVAVRQDTIYVCDDDYVRMFSSDGSPLWQSSNLSGTIYYGAPAVDSQGNIYVVSSLPVFGFTDFTLYAFFANGGNWWSYSYSGFEGNGVQLTPTVDQNQNVYVATMWSSTWPSSMQSYDNAGRNWLQNTAAMHSSPAVSGTSLYFGTKDGLQARSTSGALLWNYNASGRVTYSSPAVDNTGAVYFGTDGGRIVSLTSAGGVRWTSLQTGPLGSPALDGGRLYIAGSHFLYAFGNSAVDVPVVESSGQLRLWPNPVRYGLVYLYGAPDRPFAVSVFDVAGRRYQQLESPQTLDASSLPAGVYFVKLSTVSGQQTKRLVVER